MKTSAINNRSIERWKADVKESVLFYNDWFMRFAPVAYIDARKSAIKSVSKVFKATDLFRNLGGEFLRKNPSATTILRMVTTPPLARDRLSGLADVPRGLVKSLEEGKRSSDSAALERIANIVSRLIDRDIMPWLGGKATPSQRDLDVAWAIIGDRLCGSLADPIIRNEQERRQLECIGDFLSSRGYRRVNAKEIADFRAMPAGSFAHHLNVPAKLVRRQKVNIPVDVVIMRRNAKPGDLPLLIECKSAGDFTNTNKRRKEEAMKVMQLKATYGSGVEFMLFLCGYFDSGYLGYEAAEGIDWIWEHRISDLEKANV